MIAGHHKSEPVWLLAAVSLLALGLISYWAMGPHELAPWRLGFLRSSNLGGKALKNHPAADLADPMHDQLDKMTLEIMVQSFFTDGLERKDAEPANLAERSFTLFLALDAAVAAGLALALLIWRSENASARQLALALGLFALALAGFLINGQARLRGNVFAWPSWPRLGMEILVTLAFGLSVLRLERFFSEFPVKLEDWQVVQGLLRWRGRSLVPEQRIRRWYRPDRANLLSTIRKLPVVITGLFILGSAASTLPFVLLVIRFPEAGQLDDTVTTLRQKIGMTGWAVGVLAGTAALILFLAFGWLFAAGLIAKLRAAREQCTEDEKRQADWIFAGGLLVALMLILFSAELVFAVVYIAWGHSAMVREYGGGVAMFFFPAGWAVILLALSGAVFLSRNFGARPLIKRTLLVGAVGLLMSLLLAVIQQLVAAKLLGSSSLLMQRGLSTALAGGISLCSLGFFRKKMEQRVDGFLNRFMPATVIADGKRRDLTVVFSDLGGYTALSAADEMQALHVAGHFQKVAAEVARRQGGRIVKTIGDAVLWVFPTPAEAFAAALELPKEFLLAVERDRLPPLPVNSGVHHGSVVEAPGGDVYGAAVNLAARLQGVAKDGTVVTSAEAMLEVAGGFRFEPMGRRELKNVPTPIACFQVLGA